MLPESEDSLSLNEINCKPATNEIEISIFGPGYGECIVLHLTDNNWFVIDSCIDLNSKKSIPLKYLEQIGVSISNDLKYIIVTHWHDDHIRGISNLHKLASNSTIVLSSALLKQEFLTYVYALKERAMMTNCGIEEMYEIIQTSVVRKTQTGKTNLKHAASDKTLWKHDKRNVALISLSPSEDDYQNSLLEISGLINELKGAKKRAKHPSRNNHSIVLWVKIDNDHLLLGADMESSTNKGSGWEAISNCQVVNNSLASFYKAAHHGSITGHDDKIWERLLSKNPLVALTPFMKGKHKIPNKEDLDRICSYSKKFYATKLISLKKPVNRSRLVDKQMKEISGLKINPISYSTGHLRFRKNINLLDSDWTVEIFDAAEKINCN